MSNRKFWISAGLIVLFFPAMMLLAAGSAAWIEGWVFGLWFSAMVLSNYAYLYFKDPALLAERQKRPGSDNQKGWDKLLLSLAYPLTIAWLILMPLDAKRFGWSPVFGGGFKLLGVFLLLGSLYLLYSATVDNTFLSTLVRVQSERKQRVISTGVYGFVRHPLYLGCLMLLLGAPLLLGSLYGLAFSLVSLILLFIRILGEEKMLINELGGYEQYKKKVKYRLIPYIW